MQLAEEVVKIEARFLRSRQSTTPHVLRSFPGRAIRHKARSQLPSENDTPPWCTESDGAVDSWDPSTWKCASPGRTSGAHLRKSRRSRRRADLTAKNGYFDFCGPVSVELGVNSFPLPLQRSHRIVQKASRNRSGSHSLLCQHQNTLACDHSLFLRPVCSSSDS